VAADPFVVSSEAQSKHLALKTAFLPISASGSAPLELVEGSPMVCPFAIGKAFGLAAATRNLMLALPQSRRAPQRAGFFRLPWGGM